MVKKFLFLTPRSFGVSGELPAIGRGPAPLRFENHTVNVRNYTLLEIVVRKYRYNCAIRN